MSVGLQRLREDADAVRKGAIDKGEDPAVIDRALELDARRRALLGEGDALKAERNAASKQIGEAIKGGASPNGPEVADLKAASTAAGERIAAIDAELATVEAEVEDLLLRIPNPADPDVPIGGEEANVTVRTWGELLPVEQPVEGEVGADAPPGGATWTRKPHWELAEALDIIDNPRGAKIAGSGFPVYKGAGSALQRAHHQLVPRRPYTRERHDRDLAAGRRQRRLRHRHRPDSRQGRPDVRRHPRRPLPGPDRRGSRHEPAPRRDPRGRRSPDPLRRLLARASGARRAPRARTPGASSESTSSTRSRWSCSSDPASRTPRSSG